MDEGTQAGGWMEKPEWCVGVCVGGWVGGYETESDCTHTRPRLQVHCVISVRVHVDVADSLPSTGA